MSIKNVAAFRKNFKIDKTVNLSEAVPLIDAIYTAQQEAYKAFCDMEWDTPAIGFKAQTLFNLLSRTYEHAQAMLVASVTGSPASSEVLGRTVVEGSINVAHLTAKGNSGMLLNFLQSWVSEHDKKLTDWRNLIADRANPEVLDRIAIRKSLIESLAGYLKDVEVHCGLSEEKSRSPWPKQLFQRFQALNLEEAYFECYHRLSGACHLTGEDTINYLLSQEMTEDMQVRFGQEAWAYSRMMTMYSSIFFIDAAKACTQTFGGTSPSFDINRERISKEIVKISQAAGVPNVE